MSSFDKSEYVHGVFTKIADSYDLMNDLESLRMHRTWKARLVRELGSAEPERILDVACGTGDVAILLAKANPDAEVIGLDFNEDMLCVARNRAARELPLSFVVEVGDAEGDCVENRAARARTTNNLTLTLGDAMNLAYENESFNAVSISFGLRNMPDYAVVLQEIYRVLKPGGRFCCLEASYPTNTLVLPPFKLYFKHWLPVLGKLIVKSPEEYAWLNTSTEAFLTKDELVELMKQTGFEQTSYTSFLYGAAALHRGTKVLA